MNNYKFIKKRHPRRPAYHSKAYNQTLIDNAVTTAYHTSTDIDTLLKSTDIQVNPIK